MSRNFFTDVTVQFNLQRAAYIICFDEATMRYIGTFCLNLNEIFLTSVCRITNQGL